MSKGKIITYATALVAIVVATILGVTLNIHINETENGTNIEAIIQYAEEEVPAVIEESGQGAIITDEIPTVEAVDSNGPVTEVNNTECPEGEECGRGANVPTLDISSPQAFANQTLGVCLDVDGYYGAQCWDSMAAFFINYTGHTLYTCGTGAAKGTIADGCWQQNAGNEFTMIWNPAEIQAGDIAVYSTGEWGHIGMAMGEYNNGYFTLLGQNQGGAWCPNGGAAGNIINLSTRDFIGAFRPNIYIKPEPVPEPEPVIDECQLREVVKGDTLGKIMQECRGEVEWGAAMNDYAQHWYSLTFKRFLTVYDGWASSTGYGLFAGDTIEYRAD